MNFIIGQFWGIVGLIVSVAMVQFRNLKHVLIGSILSNLMVGLSYAFLNGMSGAWICIVAAVQALVIFLINTYDLEVKKKNIISGIFAAIYVMGTIVVYQGWVDILSCMCAFLYVLAILQTEASKYRWFMLANSVLWILYAITTGAYINIITHGSVLLSVIISKLRLDRETE